MNEFEDKKIKEFFAKDKLIPDKTNKVFDSTLEQIRRQEESKKQKISMPIFYFRKLATVAACTLMIFMGANVYARANGYNSIFFMIKEVVENKPVTQQEIFSDKEIIISYQSFSLNDYIEMQVNKLQIEDGIARLYLYVVEDKANDVTPLKYKVYNEDGTIAYEGVSSKKAELKYSEILELKKYKKDQKIITLQVFNNGEKLLKTVVIDLDAKTVEARTESIEVKKISQIKLNDFLSEETKKATKTLDNERILILKLIDITYADSVYTVKYLYNQITDEDIQKNRVESVEIFEGAAKFTIKNEKFNLIELKTDNKNQNNLQNMNQMENKTV